MGSQDEKWLGQTKLRTELDNLGVMMMGGLLLIP